jgi:hypothetical protein
MPMFYGTQTAEATMGLERLPEERSGSYSWPIP